MPLRQWQSECIDHALSHYLAHRHFFCQATPGAGKTRMAAELAKRLLEQNLVDAVVCFAPSSQVVDGLRKTFSSILNKAFDGRLGAVGMALTYQSLEYQSDTFWQLFKGMRVLAIFDEIHHCSAGDGVEGANIWGKHIVLQLQETATYTLAMSGTPWRSDEQSIALARYSTPEGCLLVDYRYSLVSAVKDGVCRIPHITLLDHPSITVKSSGGVAKTYSGFERLLKQSSASFESLSTNKEINVKLLELAKEQLDKVRETVSDAGGLVVASNIEHAHHIAEYLQNMGDGAVVVSTHRSDAGAAIEQFRLEASKWIVAVGMVSEGTDIPRLSVCCYLSRVRTELYFRQVLGRVLRRRGVRDPHAWMFMLAEPELADCAERLMEDLPEQLARCRHLKFVSVDASKAGSDRGNHALGTQISQCEYSGFSSGKVDNTVVNKRYTALMVDQLILNGNFRERLLDYF